MKTIVASLLAIVAFAFVAACGPMEKKIDRDWDDLQTYFSPNASEESQKEGASVIADWCADLDEEDKISAVNFLMTVVLAEMTRTEVAKMDEGAPGYEVAAKMVDWFEQNEVPRWDSLAGKTIGEVLEVAREREAKGLPGVAGSFEGALYESLFK